MKRTKVVLAIFENEARADAAVVSLKAWDKADRDTKLKAVGVLVLDDKGKVKTHKLGRRSAAKGKNIGLVLAAICPPALIAGAIGGGAVGALHHKGLGLKTTDSDRIAAELTNGKAAVGTLAVADEADAIAAKLTEFGGARSRSPSARRPLPRSTAPEAHPRSHSSRGASPPVLPSRDMRTDCRIDRP